MGISIVHPILAFYTDFFDGFIVDGTDGVTAFTHGNDAREQRGCFGDHGSGLDDAKDAQLFRIGLAEAEGGAQYAHFFRHHRIKQSRADTQAFGGECQRDADSFRLSLFGLRPRLFDFEVLVHFTHGGQHGSEARIKTHRVDGVFHFDDRLLNGVPKFLFRRTIESRLSNLRKFSVTVTAKHIDGAAEQIAEVVGEVAVITADESFFGERGVLAERHFGDQEIAEGIDAVAVDHFHRIDDVAEALAHFGAVSQPPAVRENGFRQRHTHCHKHGRPVNGMRGQNVFTNELVRRWPPLVELGVIALVADGGDVVQERVEPDVGDEILVERQFNAPGEPRLRARDTEVLQFFGFQKAESFVGAEIRLNKFRMRLDIFDEPVLIFAHAEEIVSFLNGVHFASALRTVAVDEILFSEETFATDAVPALIIRAVDFVAVEQVLKNFLHDHFMAVFGGADKIVVGDFETFPEFLKTDDGLVALLLWGQTVFVGGLLDFLAVFIGAGQEPGRSAKQTVIICQHVGKDRCVRVADVRLVVHIINRRCYVVALV